MPKPRKPKAPTVRTTIELPPPLWEDAKIEAARSRSDLRSVIIAALEAYLRARTARRKRGEA
jgi:hypothetical protein